MSRACGPTCRSTRASTPRSTRPSPPPRAPTRSRGDGVTRVVAYGFHGISHAWSTRRLAEVAPDARRIVVAHLGGGASLCAVRDGHSVMTTMGFTPLDGLVMATRSGALDPGAVLWMQRARRRGRRARARARERPARALRRRRHACGPAALRRGRPRGAASPSTCTSTGWSRRSARAPPRSAGSTRSCSPAASVKGAATAAASCVAARLAWLGVATEERAHDADVTELTARRRVGVVRSWSPPARTSRWCARSQRRIPEPRAVVPAAPEEDRCTTCTPPPVSSSR